MSKPKVFEKPTGVKDYLPEAVSKLRHIEFGVLECMQKWGYQEIITPTLEYYDTVGTASSTSDSKLFKLLDKKGTTIVLRSDLTAPIARVVSSLLSEQPLPLRLAYHANVFRAFEEEAGREAEFFQTGVELVGDGSPEADAEIIALAIASLKAAGIEKFKFAVGHVGFLNGLFEETLKNDPTTQTALKECLLNRDYVGYRRQISELDISGTLKSELEDVLRLRGGLEICDQAGRLTGDQTAKAAIQHLCEVWSVLQDYDVCEHVLIDLTMIGDFSYYTGMTFEGYAADLGFPVCSGGRYDNLLTHFGRPAPATGFALKTNRILEVLSKANIESPERLLVVYDQDHRKQALQRAEELRQREHVMVETRKVQNGATLPLVQRDPERIYEYEGTLYRDVLKFTGGEE